MFFSCDYAIIKLWELRAYDKNSLCSKCITFQSPETGYSVLKVSVKGYQELVTVVGNLADAVVVSVLLIDGEWTNNPKYSTQFSAQKWEETIPATAYGIEKYLGSGLIKGVGAVYAKKIVQKFGIDTIAIIEDTPERLAEVDGIGKKRIERISESLERQKEIKNIMIFLQNYDISSAYATKIYKHYGNDSIETVKQNPYRLADDIWGIDLKTADKIAFRLGFEKTHPERCRSGVLYTLNQLADEGHVYAEKEQLLKKCSELIEIDAPVVENALNTAIARNDLIVENDAIYLPPFYHTECGVAEKPLELADSDSLLNHGIQVNISALERKLNIQYDDIQVLTPMQRGVIGAANLNQLLQQNLNPAESWLTRGGRTYRLHDKVMQIKNNYDKEVFNGDIGTIFDINTIDKELTAQFENRFVKYDIFDLDELVHAYAITIHKSQGSEYPIVVMPVMMAHFIMLQRNLVTVQK